MKNKKQKILIRNSELSFNKKNKWVLTIKDKDVSTSIVIPPTKNRLDYIDRNLKYHLNYKGCVSDGILIKIENSHPKAIVIKDKIMRYWKVDECFEKYNRFIESKGNPNRKRSRSVFELA